MNDTEKKAQKASARRERTLRDAIGAIDQAMHLLSAVAEDTPRRRSENALVALAANLDKVRRSVDDQIRIEMFHQSKGA
jgi:hypothetical protein